MKKTIYVAPCVEQIEVRVEENFVATTEAVSRTSTNGSWDAETE